MKKIANMLGDALGRDEVMRAAKAQKILRDWEAIVGKPLALRSQPDKYHRGTVWVAVEGSAWAQELRMIKDRILERLGNAAGDSTLFVQIRFGVRPFVREHPVEGSVGAQAIAFVEDNDLSIREIAERRLRAWRDENRGRA